MKLTRWGALMLLILLLAPSLAAAQPTRVDPDLAWSTHRPIADAVSTASVAVSVGLDTWQSWKAPHRAHAFKRQALRDALIIGVAEVTKRLAHRTRPDGSDTLSFFSEHTALAAASGDTRLSIGLTVNAGYLRMAADKHYLTDVLAGAGVGWVVRRMIP